MKLVMTLLVRNEADMVEINLDYHLAQGVDFVLVTDHGSTDGTRERLRPYERSGVAAVIEDSDEAHHQSRRVTSMAEIARSQHHADWVLHNDADEFWWPVAGNLRDVLAAIPAGYGQIAVPRRNFLPGADGPEPFYSRVIHRETQSLNLIGEPLEPKLAHRAVAGVVVAPGNHSLTGVELRPVPDLGLLEIVHYPMRSFEQFEAKVIQIGRGYELLDERSPGVGRDQLRLLEIQRAGDLRRHWDDARLDDGTLARAIEAGTIVCDRRMETFMSALSRGAQPPPAPDATMTGRLLTSALHLALDRDTSRDAAAAAIAERDAVAMTLVARECELGGVRDELARTAAALDAVRASRLMRWTRAVRRLWYRLGEPGVRSRIE